MSRVDKARLDQHLLEGLQQFQKELEEDLVEFVILQRAEMLIRK